MVDVLLQGLLLGGLYALFALGLSLVFGVMRLTNTAHGDFIVLAAFAAIGGLTVLAPLLPDGGGAPFVVALLLLPVSFGFGYALQRWVLNGTLGRDPLPSLVVTFGLSIVIQNLLLETFSADPRSIDSEGLSTASGALPGGLAVGVLPLAIFGFAIAATAAMQWLFGRTAIGRSFRAVSDDREIAELMGLDARKVYALATAIACVLIVIAGVLQGDAHHGVRYALGRPGPAAVRLRGRHHRRHGLVLGHARRRAAARADAADRLSLRSRLGHLLRPPRVPARSRGAPAGSLSPDAIAP